MPCLYFLLDLGRPEIVEIPNLVSLLYRPFYVGIGRHLRPREHWNELKSIPRSRWWVKHKILYRQRSYKKEDVILRVMEADLPIVLAEEVKIIAYLGRRVDGGPLTNITLGGDGVNGVARSAILKAAHSARMCGAGNPAHIPIGAGWLVNISTLKMIMVDDSNRYEIVSDLGIKPETFRLMVSGTKLCWRNLTFVRSMFTLSDKLKAIQEHFTRMNDIRTIASGAAFLARGKKTCSFPHEVVFVNISTKETVIVPAGEDIPLSEIGLELAQVKRLLSGKHRFLCGWCACNKSDFTGAEDLVFSRTRATAAGERKRRAGDKNGRAKTFVLTNRFTGEELVAHGNLKEVLRERSISMHFRLADGIWTNYQGWEKRELNAGD